MGRYQKLSPIILILLMVCIFLSGSNVVYSYTGSSDKLSTNSDISKTDIAQVFITTGNKIEKNDYVQATIIVSDSISGNFDTITDKTAKIKIRGNSTASLSKKPYNIKFNSEQSVLGMSAGKKWCLLANYLDNSLLRNALAYGLARDIGMDYFCDFRYVDVWLNGVYQGNYLLTTPVETGTNRVNINEKKNDFLLELEDARVEEDATYFNSEMYRFLLNAPQKLTSKQEVWLTDYLKTVEAVMKGGNYSEIEKYVDINSFIDFYILQELFKNLDVNGSSTRFYIKNGKLYAGPIWDCDLSSGNIPTFESYGSFLLYNNFGSYGTGSGNSYEGLWAVISGSSQKPENSYIGLLLKCSQIREAFYKRYLELQNKIVALYSDNALGANKIDQFLSQYKASYQRDNDIWPCNLYRGSELYRYNEMNYSENVDFLRSWLKSRNEWLVKALKTKEYTVTLNANGGISKVMNIRVILHCYYNELPTPTKKGYKFAGWYTAKKDGNQVTNTDIVILSKSQMLYAHWVK